MSSSTSIDDASSQSTSQSIHQTISPPNDIARSASPLSRLAFWRRRQPSQSIDQSMSSILMNTSALALEAARSPKDRSTNQSIDQSNNQSSDQASDQSSLQPNEHSLYHSSITYPINQSTGQSTNQSIAQSTPVRSLSGSYYDSIPSLSVFNQSNNHLTNNSISQSLPPSPASYDQSNQSFNQPTSHSHSQSVDQTSPRPVHMPRAPSIDVQLQSLLDQSVNQLADHSTDQPSDQSSNHSTSPTKQPIPHLLKQSKRMKTLIHHLQNESINLSTIRSICWSGCPTQIRPIIWKLMLGVLPVSKHRRDAALHSRRCEYWEYLRVYDQSINQPTTQYDDMLRQIRADIPRTCPGISFFQHQPIKQSIERVLFTFALRHPASGYVQGMNDLVTPFYAVFIREYIDVDIIHNEAVDQLIDRLDDDWLMFVEADCYWCLSALMDGIQDHFTFAQPGIQRQIFSMQAIVERVDPALIKHFECANIQFLHFAFRWMNCLLMRELSLPLILRLWDSYLCHENGPVYGFKTFHIYFSVAFLIHFSRQLQMLEFADLIVYLQKLPTEAWKQQQINELVAQAFIFQTLFEGETKLK